MAVHKTIDQAAKNLEAAATFIPARYKEGVSAAEWEQAASSAQAETNYQEGIADAIAKGKRQAGIHTAGNQKYRTNAINKGGAVIGTRIKEAIPAYRANMAPVLSAMNSAADSLPSRTRDPLANINNRLIPIVLAAIAAKKR